MIREPSKPTLKRYGLSLEEWKIMLGKQEGVCYVCRKEPPSQTLCIDHFHVPKWKKMPPEKRKLYVRGLLCAYCNLRLLRKGWTLEKLQRAVTYVQAFEEKLKLASEH